MNRPFKGWQASNLQYFESSIRHQLVGSGLWAVEVRERLKTSRILIYRKVADMFPTILGGRRSLNCGSASMRTAAEPDQNRAMLRRGFLKREGCSSPNNISAVNVIQHTDIQEEKTLFTCGEE